MAKRSKLPLLIGLGAVVAIAAAQLKKPGDLVSAKSGKTWRVVMLSNVGGVKTYELWSPAGSFGPHDDMLVLTYQQTGSDTASRKKVSLGPGALEAMVNTAASDFGVTL